MMDAAHALPSKPIEGLAILHKENPFQTKIQTMLNSVYQFATHQAVSHQKDVHPTSQAIPHRFSGEADLTGKQNAIRAVLSTGALPKYREVSSDLVEPTSLSQEKPTIKFHMFCEVGDFASLDPSQTLKLSAVSQWHAPNGESLQIIMHPFDNTLTQRALRGGSKIEELAQNQQLAQISPDDSEDERKKAMLSLYVRAKKTKPPVQIDINTADNLLLNDPLKDIKSAIQNLAQADEQSKIISIFALITTGAYSSITGKRFGHEEIAVKDESRAEKLPLEERDIPVVMVGDRKTDQFYIATVRGKE